MIALIAFLADGMLLVLLSAAAVSLLFGTTLRQKLAGYPYVVMGGLTSLLVGKLLSLLYQPAVQRPFLELGVTPGAAYIDNPGFPSDHTLLAVFAALTVMVFVRNRYLSAFMVIAVAGIGLGRILAFVHTPLDILGGILAGLAGGIWYYGLTKRQQK